MIFKFVFQLHLTTYNGLRSLLLIRSLVPRRNIILELRVRCSDLRNDMTSCWDHLVGSRVGVLDVNTAEFQFQSWPQLFDFRQITGSPWVQLPHLFSEAWGLIYLTGSLWEGDNICMDPSTKWIPHSYTYNYQSSYFNVILRDISQVHCPFFLILLKGMIRCTMEI